MNLHGQNFIGDRLQKGGGETFRAVNPLDSAPLAPDFAVAGVGEVNDAMEQAAAAFAEFRETTGEQRAVFLERIAEEIMALGDEFIARARQETGLSDMRLSGERARTIYQLKLFAQLVREGSWVDARIDTALPDRRPAPKPDLRRLLVPLGPVIVFGASNFPFAYSVAGGDTASALAAGNPVVVKAHERHPGVSEMAATAIRRAAEACKLPPGTFSMLHGLGKTVGLALVKHPEAKAVGFTGSRLAGRALFDAAASRPDPIPVFAEMSSLNPVFILPQALRERGQEIADGLRQSVTLGVGQFCTKPGLVFGLDSAEWDQFRHTMAQTLEAIAPGTMLHAGIRDAYAQGLARVAKVNGLELLARSRSHPEAAKTEGETVLASASADTFCRHPELAEEVFGPFSILFSAQSIAELEKVAERLDGQLTASIHGSSEDFRHAGRLLKLLETKAGRLVINGFPTGVEVCPSMNHGGPYPATTDSRFSSVGTSALLRFARPVCYQNFPVALLPDALKDGNPLGIWRTLNGTLTKDAVA